MLLELNKIYNMDCVEGMKSLIPDNSIDIVITSPPYAVVAKQLNRYYIGFEISKEYCKIAEERLNLLSERGNQLEINI